MAKKQMIQPVNTAIKELLYGVVALVLAYAIGSWAIDSGSILVYLMFFISVYYALRSFKQAIIIQFFNDKTTPARAAKKAHRK